MRSRTNREPLPPSPPADPASYDQLQVLVEHHEGRCTLTLAGQLDLATCPIFDNVVAESITAAPDLVRIQLGELQFMDSSGLRSLLRAAEHCLAADIELEVTRGADQVQRLFELTDVTGRLPFVD